MSGLRFFGTVYQDLRAPITVDQINDLLNELWEHTHSFPHEVVMTVPTYNRFKEAIRQAQGKPRLRAHVMRVNAGARRRQQRRSK